VADDACGDGEIVAAGAGVAVPSAAGVASDGLLEGAAAAAAVADMAALCFASQPVPRPPCAGADAPAVASRLLYPSRSPSRAKRVARVDAIAGDMLSMPLLEAAGGCGGIGAPDDTAASAVAGAAAVGAAEVACNAALLTLASCAKWMA